MNAKEIFRPLPLRLLAVALAGGWTLLELWRGEIFWVILGFLATSLAYWEFFGSGDYDGKKR